MNLGFFRRVEKTRAAYPDFLDLACRRLPLVVAVSPRARRLTLRADPAKANVRLTLPKGVSAHKALAFLAAHDAWLAARIEKWPMALPIVDGARLPFGDGTLTIAWSPVLPRTAHLDADRLHIGGPVEGLAGRVERWLKAEALAKLEVDSIGLAASVGLPPPAVRVGDPKSRWGSCSSRGGLVYSWRLVMAPVFVRRAVAAHEVAHLVHHNHSPAFHSLADDLCGGTAKAASRWLAASGASLHWVGRR
jgi:predicted metal-dependent hydrolase